MSPKAVSVAKVFTGPIRFFNGGEVVDRPENIFVEVGKWKAAGNESRPEEYQCTFYAALLLGYTTSWLPAGDDKNNDRKLLIGNGGISDDGGPESFTSLEEATRVADHINDVLAIAQALRQLK